MANNTQTFLGFDFGEKRIGTAVGQNITNQARPLITISAEAGVPKWQDIQNLIDEWRPNAMVVGIPYNMDGSEQFTTELAKVFATELNQRFHLPVHEIDERLTTVAARDEVFEQGGYKALKNKEIDCYAAKLILETWLNTNIQP